MFEELVCEISAFIAIDLKQRMIHQSDQRGFEMQGVDDLWLVFTHKDHRSSPLQPLSSHCIRPLIVGRS